MCFESMSKSAFSYPYTRAADAVSRTRRTGSTIGANVLVTVARNTVSAARFAFSRASRSGLVICLRKSTRYTPRSGDTVFPSRSAPIASCAASAVATHWYSGAIVRTVLL
jgi:hypothetical protein